MSNSKTIKTNYILEIYEPGDDSCVAAHFESETPFVPLSKGEYINPGLFTMTDTRSTLEVVSIEHIFWEIDGSHQTQKVCIRTKIADNPFK